MYATNKIHKVDDFENEIRVNEIYKIIKQTLSFNVEMD